GLVAVVFFVVGGLIVLLFEASGGRVGVVMTSVVVVFLAYNAFGASLPGILAHRGFELERIVRFEVFTGAGLFGLPIGVASSTVFVFVLFGALLECTGGGRFFINLAFAAAGRARGGPAKAAVVASAALGSVSGSAIANTVTTGALTIPMMKRLGFSREEAGGIEAAASTGGQLMPPIMGAGAFLMAELTNTPYPRIVLVSLLPAVLFFAGTLFFVHGLAVRRGIEAMPSRPRILATLAEGAHFLAAVAVVVALLLMNYSPPLVGAAGCLAVVVTGALRRRTRVGPRQLLDGLARGAVTAVPVSLACAAAGIVVGVIGQTGVGLQFAELLLSASQGALLPALGLSALVALVLGMGLPVTAAYIVVAVVAAPALTGLGVPLLTAHLILFWLSQTSNVTPPIALAAFAGAGVAGGRPMPTAFQAVRLAAGLFMVPLLMAYTPLLPGAGEPLGPAQGVAFVGGLVAMAAVALALYGHGVRAVSWPVRLLLAAGALLLLFPDPLLRVAGAGLAALGFLPQFRGRRS
ncbi:MAG: TRAP transporter fused permease subunit, partial [Acidobacteria bacterium]|nr:TRAP transporter fused permease subunit [Acidobacteriota bacterium]